MLITGIPLVINLSYGSNNLLSYPNIKYNRDYNEVAGIGNEGDS